MRYQILVFMFGFCAASYHEQYRIPKYFSDKLESYVYNGKEYIIQNLAVSFENAKILCGGHFDGTLALLDTKEKADFLAEALSESQFEIDSIWVGARRDSADDPEGYRWSHGVELRRTAADVLVNEAENPGDRYPMWLNRTLVPVPESGADCVAIERVQHDRPVFLDLPCELQRPFACERETKEVTKIKELKIVRCSTGLYRIFDGKLKWKQAASYCLLENMTLANIASEKCLRKIGVSLLKTRPSIENAWIGARGFLGKWKWVDTGIDIFQDPAFDAMPGMWPPMKDRSLLKQKGCLQLDRHESNVPVFLESRCDRKMQFICYQRSPLARMETSLPSDDQYYYVLIKQMLYWQHALENCEKMKGTLATLDSRDVLIQLLLLMGENKNEPVNHIWVSGRLNMSKDGADNTIYAWHNANGRRIPDKSFGLATGLYMPPWLDEDFTMGSPCLNLDRLDHLNGLVYGLPCDTAQYSVCVIEKVKATVPVISVTEAEIQ